MKSRIAFGVLAPGLLHGPLASADGDLPARFWNQGSVANTRHNLTQRPRSGGGAAANTASGLCQSCHLE